MESRLLLTGNQPVDAPLDYEIWNLDSIQAQYQVISQSGNLPTTDALLPAEMSFRASSGPALRVEWVVVPGMIASPEVADTFAYQQFREAMSQGVFTADEIAPLYSQWRNNLGSYSGLDSAPIYAIGILRSGPTLSSDVVSDSITGHDTVSYFAEIGRNGDVNIAGDIASPYADGGAFSNFTVGVGSDVFDIGPTLTFSNPTASGFLSNDVLVDTNVLDSSSVALADATAIPSVTLSSAANVSTPGSHANLGEVVDNLLSDHVIIVRQTPPTDTTLSGDVASEVASLAESTQPVVVSSTVGTVSETVVAVAADAWEDGGMIPVEELVGAVARGEIEAVTTTTYAATGTDGAEIVGELTRAAVMELIEGETDPVAPKSTADYTSLVATSDATIVPATTTLQKNELRRDADSTASERAIKILAGQAGLAVSMMAPANPVYLAAIANSVSDAFAAAIVQPPAAAARDGAARNAAFSQWGGQRRESDAAAHDDSNSWLDAVPLVTMLACERVVADKNRRQQQRHPNGRPAKAK